MALVDRRRAADGLPDSGDDSSRGAGNSDVGPKDTCQQTGGTVYTTRDKRLSADGQK